MGEVESEVKHMREVFKDFLLTPITFVLFLFGKRTMRDLIEPIRELWNFFWDAKMTAILIMTNVLVFVLIWAQLVFNFLGISDFRSFAENYLFCGPRNLREFNILAIFMSRFVHIEFWHLFWNCVFLFIFGRVVEKHLGSGRLLLVYILSGMVSGIANSLIFINNLDYFSYGASGGIAGLGALAILFQPYSITFLVFGMPVPIIFVVWFQMFGDFYDVIRMTDDNVAHFSHLTGYIFATLFTFLVLRDQRQKMKKGLLINVITAVVLGLGWYFLGGWIVSTLGNPSFYNLGKLLGSLVNNLINLISG